MKLQWMDESKTILAATDQTGHVVILEPNLPQWSEYSVREDIDPYIPPPPPPTPTPKQIAALRLAAYQSESDPLFFKWQRGEGTEQAWLDKIEQIKARYPEPSTPE
jgi:hypothetical protein